jgi:hypothetical protein
VGADPLALDPEHWRVEVDNEAVRALRYGGDPRGNGMMHGYPAHVVVFLTDTKTPVHKTAASPFYPVDKAGAVISVLAGESAPENLFDDPVETIVVEHK